MIRSKALSGKKASFPLPEVSICSFLPRDLTAAVFSGTMGFDNFAAAAA